MSTLSQFSTGFSPQAGNSGFLGDLKSFLIGDKDQFHQLSTMSPEQQSLLGQVTSGIPKDTYQQAQSYLSQMLNRDPGTYDKFAAPYLQQFQEKTIPQLAERFAGLGGGLGGGALSSSGFGQALGGAGAGLQSQLASLFANLQQNAAGQAMGQYNQQAALGLGARPFENAYQPGSTGALGGLLSAAGTGLGMAGGAGLAKELIPLLMGLL